MKILTFTASNSRKSINRSLIDFAISRLQEGIAENAEFEVLGPNDFEMPIYSIDRERDGGIPELTQTFFTKIGEADAILVSFAEHNGFITSAWKNIFGWMSWIEMKLWQGKPLVMLAATPGRRAGANVLESQKTLTPHFGADLRGTLRVGKWPEAWDPETKDLFQADDLAALDEVLAQLLRKDIQHQD